MTKRTPKLYLRGAVVGEYGKTFVVTLKNFKSVIQDVSAYSTSKVWYFRSPDGHTTITSTGAFVTDGSDAQVSWSFDSDSYLTRPGVWDAQLVLKQTGQVSKTYMFEIECDASLGGD